MPRVSLKKVDVISALLLLPICAWVFYESGKWPHLPDLGNPGWIPRGVAVCLLICAAMMLVQAFTGRSLTIPGRLEGADRARVLWVAGLTAAYVLLVARLGFIAATAPYLFGFGLALGERRWVRLAVFAVVVPVVTYLVFDRALNVPLPEGWFR